VRAARNYRSDRRPHANDNFVVCITGTFFPAGRDFFICALPKGDPSDPNTRCSHFEWAQRRASDSVFNRNGSRKPSPSPNSGAHK